MSRGESKMQNAINYAAITRLFDDKRKEYQAWIDEHKGAMDEIRCNPKPTAFQVKVRVTYYDYQSRIDELNEMEKRIRKSIKNT